MTKYDITIKGKTLRPPEKKYLRAGRLDPFHEAFIQAARGDLVHYYEASRCSCVGQDGQPQLDCDCENGFRYPAEPYKTIVSFSSLQVTETQGKNGLVTQGEAGVYITRSNYRMDWEHLPYRDRFSDNPLYNRIHLGDILVVPGKLRRQHDVLQKGSRDTLNAFEVQHIERIMSSTTEYQQDVDYVLGPTDPEQRTIEWLGNDEPSTGDCYTVEFVAPLTFIVYNDVPNNIGGIGEEIPKMVRMKIRQWDDPGVIPDTTDFHEDLGMGVLD